MLPHWPFLQGFIMSLEAHERDELNRLWREHNNMASLVADHAKIISLQQDRQERMATDLDQFRGGLAAQLATINKTTTTIDKKLLTLDVQQQTRGGLIDRWLPLLISGVCALAVIKDFIH
jgi:hypothetical protein